MTPGRAADALIPISQNAAEIAAAAAEIDDQKHADVRAVLDALGQAGPAWDRAVADALARGHAPTAVVAEASRPVTGDARSPEAIMLTRIRRLAEVKPAAVPKTCVTDLPPHCGRDDCGDGSRASRSNPRYPGYRRLDSGRGELCPCHPDHPDHPGHHPDTGATA